MNDTLPKEYPVKDERGKVALTVKLREGKSRIFIGDKEILTCRAVLLRFPKKDRKKINAIDSINDFIAHPSYVGSDANGPSIRIPPELDFFVNCSNLEAWVLHDFDTKLLDYRLSFPLLKELEALDHDPRVLKRLREELKSRYMAGNDTVRKYLKKKFQKYLNVEEYFSGLPERERDAIYAMRARLPQNYEVPGKTLMGETVEGGHVSKFIVWDWTDKMPPELLDLPHLRTLTIHSFLKEVSAWLNNMPCLEEIDIAHEKIGKLFPGLKNFPSLKKLRIRQTGIKRLPASIGSLSSLKRLEIFECTLSRISNSIGKLHQLEEMDIHDTDLKSLPPSIGNLNNLKKLTLNDNKLQGLPKSFSQLNNLIKLNLRDKNIMEFPREIIVLRSLLDLRFHNFHLDRLPEEIGNFKKLERLHLEDNNLKELPETIGNIMTLEELHVGGNQLTGLPESIGTIENLKGLWINNNKISTFPKELRNSTSIKGIFLHNNPIKSLPNWLPEMPNLMTVLVTNTKIPPNKLTEYKQKFQPIQIDG